MIDYVAEFIVRDNVILICDAVQLLSPPLLSLLLFDDAFVGIAIVCFCCCILLGCCCVNIGASFFICCRN